MLFYTFFFFLHLSFFSLWQKQVKGKASISIMFTKNCESIRLMFEYQTTGTHLTSYSALRFCLLMPERSRVGRGRGTSACLPLIGGTRPWAWGRRRRRKAAPHRPSPDARRRTIGTLRCCGPSAWLVGRFRALGPGLLAGGSCGVPTALRSEKYKQKSMIGPELFFLMPIKLGSISQSRVNW